MPELSPPRRCKATPRRVLSFERQSRKHSMSAQRAAAPVWNRWLEISGKYGRTCAALNEHNRRYLLWWTASRRSSLLVCQSPVGEAMQIALGEARNRHARLLTNAGQAMLSDSMPAMEDLMSHGEK